MSVQDLERLAALVDQTQIIEHIRGLVYQGWKADPDNWVECAAANRLLDMFDNAVEALINERASTDEDG